MARSEDFDCRRRSRRSISSCWERGGVKVSIIPPSSSPYHKIHHYHHHHLGLLMLSWCWDLDQVWLLTAALWGFVMVMIEKILLMTVLKMAMMDVLCYCWWTIPIWDSEGADTDDDYEGRIWRWRMVMMVHYSDLRLVSSPPRRSQTSARSLCLIWGENFLIVIKT